MLKYLILIILLTSIASPVFAYDMEVDLPNFTEENATLDTFLPAMFNLLITLAGIAALIMIMVGGYQYMTAGGSETRTGSAKDRIKNAILGLILALCSYLILNTINPNLAENLRLPGLDTIDISGFDWEDYTPEMPGPGSTDHNVLDGNECNSPQACFCSRECKEWWQASPVASNLDNLLFTQFTQKALASTSKYETEEECKAKHAKCQKTEKKYCTPVEPARDKDGKIITNSQSGKLAKKEGSDKLWVLYMEKCDAPDKHEFKEEQCYDEDAVCHNLHNFSCYERSVFGSPCIKDADCSGYNDKSNKRICNASTKLCDTEDGKTPPGEERKNQMQLKESPEHDGYKYYLFESPYKIGIKSTKDKKGKDSLVCADEVFNTVWIPNNHNGTILCASDSKPQNSSSIESNEMLSYLNVTDKALINDRRGGGLLYLELGWLIHDKYGKDVKCQDVHGPNFQDYKQKDHCDFIENEFKKDNKCCEQYYACCTINTGAMDANASKEACQKFVPMFDSSIPTHAIEKIETAGEGEMIEALGWDMKNEEIWNLPRILCKIKITE